MDPAAPDVLARPLSSDNVSERKGPGGKTLVYIDGYSAVQLANRLFGPYNWKSEVIKKETINAPGDKGVICSVTLRVEIIRVNAAPPMERPIYVPGNSHTEIGHGVGRGGSYEDMVELAEKTAFTDALKRCLRLWGEALGLCLYDDEWRTEHESSKKLKIEPLPPPPTFPGIKIPVKINQCALSAKK